MKKTIASYTIDAGPSLIYMPAGAQILSVGSETLAVGGGVLRTSICVSALVDEAAPLEPRKLLVIGTWLPCESDVLASQCIGRVECGALTYHVFDQQRA